jgi:Family of unknown function (DUF5335)
MEQPRELAYETWDEYFDAVSRELLNAPVSIQIIAAGGPSRVEADRLALQNLTYDRRGDVFEVAAARGGPHLPCVLRHMVDHPQRVAVDSRVMLAPMTISVDGRDGRRTVITIARDPDITG